HQDYSAPFLYEGAVGGSIPILHNLEQFFKQQEITSIRGILNGSTNYVLSKMRTEKLSFEDALELAQSEGFAESDPSLDISGKDAMFKLIILAYHAFGQTITDFSQIRVESITNMEDQFYELAELQGQKIKSVATAYRKTNGIRLKIQPELVEATDALYGVENEHNAIIVDANYSGNQIFSGKGAGSLPTASAVINDLSLLINGFKYSLKRPQSPLKKSA
ncbi:MAG: homoserine dehydrogenase, partial [Marinoscillum sp.]